MENIQEDNNINDMPPSENSETSRLVAPNTGTRTNYVNLVNNICAILFTGIIIYCSFANGVTLFSFHPTLMSLGWIIFMTSAVNAITPGDLATEWMPIRLRSARHWVIQVLTGIIVITGFFIILSNKIILGKNHFATLHAKFGLASVILMLMTMLGGIGALYSLKLKRYLAPLYTKLLHGSVGLVTFFLGIVTICLGLFSEWFKFGNELKYISLFLVIAVLALTILRPLLKIYFRLKERLENSN